MRKIPRRKNQARNAKQKFSLKFQKFGDAFDAIQLVELGSIQFKTKIVTVELFLIKSGLYWWSVIKRIHLIVTGKSIDRLLSTITGEHVSTHL